MPPKAGPKVVPKAAAKGPPAAMIAKLKMAMQAQKEAEERARREEEEEEKRRLEEERLLALERKREEEEREMAKEVAKEREKVDKKDAKLKLQQEHLERMRAAGFILPDLDKKDEAPKPAAPKPKPKPKHEDPVVAAPAPEPVEKKDELEDDWEALLEAETQAEVDAQARAEAEAAAKVEAEKAAAEAAVAAAAAEAAAKLKPAEKDLRSPICCVLGHVDTGKTSLLDRIRKTNVQGGEAGGITQQIGATFFPKESLEIATGDLRHRHGDVQLNVPGLLVIDTPGHESFTNLRSRGTTLCDIAVLVVDIMHGLEPQTRESMRLLRDRKCPFIVALNKVDRLLDWKAHENMDIEQSLSLQLAHVRQEFETRSRDILLQFAEEGFNAEIHFRNSDKRRYVSVVPTSAKTGEGICDLLLLKIQLVQQFMETKVQFKEELQCTVLEVKPIQGFGTTIDVVLVNGTLHEGDQIMVCGLAGPIITTIRALLTPQPLKELRVKGDYVHHQSLRAAIGVKISAQDLDEAVPGTQLMVIKPGVDVAKMRAEIMKDMNDVLSDVSKSGVGVSVQSSTLGALEALLSFLKTSKIPVSSIALGPLHKKHLQTAKGMKDRSKKHAVILAFDVTISKEAAEEAAKYEIPIFSARIIYHLFDAFTAYVSNFEKAIMEKNRDIAVFPCELSGFTKIRNKDPIIVGCNVDKGQLHVGTPLAVVTGGVVTPIGRVIGIEDNQKEVKSVKKGKTVAVKITAVDTTTAFGRHFDENSKLISVVSRDSIDALKESFRAEMSDDDWKLVIALKKALGVM